jgi:hypothetical protein
MSQGFLIDAGATILCPHGGSVTLVPSATRVTLGGQPPLLADDALTIAGCAFNVSGSPSPCMEIQWLEPAAAISIEGGAPILSSSIGVCKNAAGVPQGTAVVTGFQTRVQGK